MSPWWRIRVEPKCEVRGEEEQGKQGFGGRASPTLLFHLNPEEAPAPSFSAVEDSGSESVKSFKEETHVDLWIKKANLETHGHLRSSGRLLFRAGINRS